MYKLAIFDMDGTILDSLEDIVLCCNRALEDFGFPSHPREAYHYFIGNGARTLVQRSMPKEKQFDEALLDAVHARYTAYYKDHGNDHTCPYPGIVDILTKLKENGVRLGVVSNKPNAPTNELAELHFPGLFDLVFGERNGVPIKPAPNAIYEMMEHLDVTAGETIYFGDSGVDMETGVNAGLYTVGVLWGFRPKNELEENGANCTIDKVEQIADLILN